MVSFIRSNVQSHSILNFLLSVFPPVKDNAGFSALQNASQAAFMAVCMFYIVTVRKPIGNFFFGKKTKNETVLGSISLICKTFNNLVFMWWLMYKLFLFEICSWESKFICNVQNFLILLLFNWKMLQWKRAWFITL